MKLTFDQKINLIIKTIEAQLELLKLELNNKDSLEDNIIKISDLITSTDKETEPDYYEEDSDETDSLLNNIQEREFYKKFKLQRVKNKIK